MCSADAADEVSEAMIEQSLTVDGSDAPAPSSSAEIATDDGAGISAELKLRCCVACQESRASTRCERETAEEDDTPEEDAGQGNRSIEEG